MIVLKTNKLIFGAKLTAAEKKALDIEINKAIAEALAEHYMDVDATFLWAIHQVCGFGKKKLHDIYLAYAPALRGLCKHYEMDVDDDSAWLCRRMLEGEGIKLEEWRGEIE